MFKIFTRQEKVILKYVIDQNLVAKSQIKAIEKIKENYRIDSDKIWKKASEWYKQKWFSTRERIIACINNWKLSPWSVISLNKVVKINGITIFT